MKNTYGSRIVSLIVYIILLLILFFYTGHLNIENKTDMILLSTFVVMAINLFVVEPFFTKPTDVVSASLNLILLFYPFYFDENSGNIFYFIMGYTLLTLVISSLAILLFSSSCSTHTKRNKISNFLMKTTVCIGKSKYLFGLAVAYILLRFYWKSDCLFLSLIIIYFVALFFDNPRQLIALFINKLSEHIKIFTNNKCTLESIGEVVAIQANKVYIINIFKDLKSKIIEPFNWFVVKNLHDDIAYECLVIDIYTLENERKIKALKFGRHETTENLKYNVAYKISEPKYGKSIRENFVGVVCENSDISQIKFEYLSQIFISDGDLVKVSLRNKEKQDIDVLYQVVQAVTNIEYYDNKNEVGLITATAVQLGVWQKNHRNFENYGWVPNINTPVLLAKNVIGPELKDEEIEIGTIPNTNFNVLVNSEEIITHHLAILGTTGSGKSVFARKLIRNLANQGNKIFCLDFTGEIKKYLTTTKLIDELEEFKVCNYNQKCTISSHIKTLTKKWEQIMEKILMDGKMMLLVWKII